jgi:hypothetical protein
MNERLGSLAVSGFGWCVGLIVLWRSWRFAFAESAWIRPALGGIEIVAAVLFLLSVTTAVVGFALPEVFLYAAVLKQPAGELA